MNLAVEGLLSFEGPLCHERFPSKSVCLHWRFSSAAIVSCRYGEQKRSQTLTRLFETKRKIYSERIQGQISHSERSPAWISWIIFSEYSWMPQSLNFNSHLTILGAFNLLDHFFLGANFFRLNFGKCFFAWNFMLQFRCQFFVLEVHTFDLDGYKWLANSLEFALLFSNKFGGSFNSLNSLKFSEIWRFNSSIYRCSLVAKFLALLSVWR